MNRNILKSAIRIFSSIAIIAGILMFGNSHTLATPVHAGVSQNVSGFAWSANTGWLSFNSLSDGSGTSYGVNIDPATGNFSGFAWSEHVGWVKFNPAGSYPANPQISARLDCSTGKVSGWARVCAVAADPINCTGGAGSNTGGWDGWINLGDTGHGDGVTKSGNNLLGWAWGDDKVGWLSFNSVSAGSAIAYGVKIDPAAGVCNGGTPSGDVGVTLTALPVNVASGGTTTLTWTSANATQCTATSNPSGVWGGQKAYNVTASEQTGPITSPTVFTLTCTGPGGSAVATATVAPMGQVAVTLTASSVKVPSGGTTNLSWTSANATQCVASNNNSNSWAGIKPIPSGSDTSGPITSTTVFTITCTGTGGTAVASATVIASGLPTGNVGVTLNATPVNVASGGTTTLSWTSANATQCTASNNNGNTWTGLRSQTTNMTGETSGPITTPTTFTLTCSGPGGSATASATVAPIGQVAVTLTAAPVQVGSGGTTTLTWTSANATQCTASNNNGNTWTGLRSQTTNMTGETSGPITSTTIFTLTCTGTGGTAVATATVIANSGGGSPTLSVAKAGTGSGMVTSSPTGISCGTICSAQYPQNTQITLTASPDSASTFAGWSGGGCSGTGTCVVTLGITNTTVTASFDGGCGAGGCGGGGGGGGGGGQPSISFTATPAHISRGDSSTLQWTTTNMASCKTDGAVQSGQPISDSRWVGSLPLFGSKIVMPTKSTTYRLTCDGTTVSTTIVVTTLQEVAP